MLFDSTETLHASLAKLRLRDPNDRIDVVMPLFHDYHDPEINRLFASSPPAPDEMVSYNFERDNKKKDQHKELMRDSLNQSQDEEEEEEPAPVLEKQVPFEALVRPVEVPVITKEVDDSGTATATATVPSLLSLQLRSEHKQSVGAAAIGGVTSNQKGITVYGPDREPVEVYIDGGDTVAVVIRKTLDAHEKAGMEPALRYDLPQCYDLRLHEGDGEPDEDFPALDRKRQLKQFGNMNEFCLCRNSEPFPKKAVPAPSKATTAGGASKGQNQDESFDQLSSRVQRGSCANDSKVVNVIIPHSGSMKLNIDDSTSAKDLLLLLAQKPRMRMLRDEFVLHLDPADKARLQFTSTMLPPDTLIAPLGVQNLEFRKRYYADDPDTKAAARPEEISGDGVYTRSGKKEGSQTRENILYTDITAAVYQEWTVLKKNKFGRIQERIMGIDSSKIYNYETQTRNAASVRHAQRNLSSVLKIDFVPGADRAFKILYADEGREPYEIEYQCTTSRNCAEIVCKIKYLLSSRDAPTKR